jgi:hypothetical protein
MPNQKPDAFSDDCVAALFVIFLIFASFFGFKAISGRLLDEAQPSNAVSYDASTLPQLRVGQSLDFRDGKNRAALLAGWSSPEPQGVWSTGTESYFGVILPQEGRPKRLTVKAAVFLDAAKLPKQRIEVWSGKTMLTATVLTTAQAQFDVPLERAHLDEKGALLLAIHLPDSTSPRQLLGTPDDRMIAIQLISIRAPA